MIKVRFFIRLFLSIIWLASAIIYYSNCTDNIGYGVPAMFIGGSILIWVHGVRENYIKIFFKYLRNRK